MTKYRNKITHWNALEESWPKQKISELDRNREKIASSHQRVRDVSGLTNQVRRIVQSMSKRDVQQKLLMYLVAAFLVVAVIVILRS